MKLINTNNFVAKLIDLMYNLKNKSGVEKKTKIICSLVVATRDPMFYPKHESPNFYMQKVILKFLSHF